VSPEPDIPASLPQPSESTASINEKPILLLSMEAPPGRSIATLVLAVHPPVMANQLKRQMVS